MKQVQRNSLTEWNEPGDDEAMMEFERQLRADARTAMMPPSVALRERTLASLDENPKAITVPARSWALPALAAGLLMAISAALAAVLLAPRPLPVIPGELFVQTQLNFTLPRTTTPSLGEPLLNEARLLARDAQRTFARFKDGLPSPPRFSSVEGGTGTTG